MWVGRTIPLSCGSAGTARPASTRKPRWVYTLLAIQTARVMLCGMFTAAKDLMSSKAAKAYANNLVSRYGTVDELTIDSKRRRIELVVSLNGEVSPVGVTIEKYQVVPEGGKTFVEVLDSSCTRPWLQAAMRDHLHGRRFELPSWAAAAL